MAVDVMLIYPPYSYPRKSPPVGLAYLAAVLEEKGYKVIIIDLSVSSFGLGKLREQLSVEEPRIVGVSFMTNQYREAINIASIAKEACPKALVVAGGPHASVLPVELLQKSSFDAVAIGEGEATIVDIAEMLSKGATRLEGIKGIVYKSKGDIRANPPREPITDIDSLPFPSWHLLELDKYSILSSGGEARERVYAILSSRGCPNRCVFCDSHSVFGRRFRGRSAVNIYKEILFLHEKFNARQFDFIDDTFTVDRERVFELCDLIVRNNLGIKWMCNARVNTVDLEMLKAMNQAGCVRIEFGVESGDQEVLEIMKKGITISQIKDAHKMAKEAGLSVGTFAMVGNFGEGWDSVIETEKLLSALGSDDICLSIATPFPGTEMYSRAKREGLLLTEDWSRYVTSPTYLPGYWPVMKTDKMEANEILDAFFYLHSRFFGRKFRTRYGKLFFANPRFYRDMLFGSGGIKGLAQRMRMAVQVLRQFIWKKIGTRERNHE